MKRFDWVATGAGRAALGALAISTIVFGYCAVHAVRIEAVPELPAPQFGSAAALAAPSTVTGIDVEAAVGSDLFAADRSAPARHYRAPGEDSDEAVPREAAVLPVVLGTAVADPAHSFATVQLGESHAVIMHVGDKIGEYTVQSIERERVVFTTAAKKKLEIPELKP
jgi:hypothetical protein